MRFQETLLCIAKHVMGLTLELKHEGSQGLMEEWFAATLIQAHVKGRHRRGQSEAAAKSPVTVGLATPLAMGVTGARRGSSGAIAVSDTCMPSRLPRRRASSWSIVSVCARTVVSQPVRS